MNHGMPVRQGVCQVAAEEKNAFFSWMNTTLSSE
jgi:hypothetical protein